MAKTAHCKPYPVPILTQPEDWALLEGKGQVSGTSQCSNPHPARRLGATESSCLGHCQDWVPILTQPEDWALQNRFEREDDWAGSNPHPARRLGATKNGLSVILLSNVPILTQPEDWALPKAVTNDGAGNIVPILTQPEDWALQWPPFPPANPPIGSNPHPARRLGATLS